MKNKDAISLARNRSQILDRVYSDAEVLRGELPQRTELSPATVIRVTRQLVKEKILKEVEPPQKSVGRPSPGLRINEKYASVLGLSLSMSTARALLMDMQGTCLKEATAPLDCTRGPTGILGPLRRVVRDLTRKPPRGAPPLKGVGLAMSGQYDRNAGISLTYPRVSNWRDVPVRDEVAKWIKVPLDVIGYMHALALGERRHLGQSTVRDLLCIEVEENVAMGAIVNGRPLEGCGGSAGELGHVTIEPSGPLCHCGNQGCLETLATCQAVEQRARSSAALADLFGRTESVSYDRLVEIARGGHPFGVRLLRQAGGALGMGLATAVNLFNPECVVLSGHFFEAGDLVLKPLWETVQSRAVPNNARRVKLARSELKGRGPALGAGWLAIEQVLKRV